MIVSNEKYVRQPLWFRITVAVLFGGLANAAPFTPWSGWVIAIVAAVLFCTGAVRVTGHRLLAGIPLLLPLLSAVIWWKYTGKAAPLAFVATYASTLYAVLASLVFIDSVTFQEWLALVSRSAFLSILRGAVVGTVAGVSTWEGAWCAISRCRRDSQYYRWFGLSWKERIVERATLPWMMISDAWAQVDLTLEGSSL